MTLKIASLKIIKNYVSLMAYVVFLCASSNSFAADSSEKIATKNQPTLRKIETYLNNIKNLSANFTQESPDGTIAEGKFLLSRDNKSSGKMRVEYMAEPKVIIVVNGPILSYKDVELDEISRLSTNTTPASFLTRPNISFDAKDVEITDFQSSEETTKISVMKRNRKEAGEFSLIFKNNPIEFIKMEVKNDLGEVVRVNLSDIDFNASIPSRMFVIKDKLIQ